MRKVILTINFISVILLNILFICYIILSYDGTFENENIIDLNNQILSDDKATNILIIAVGDCTIGYDVNFGYGSKFNEVYDQY